MWQYKWHNLVANFGVASHDDQILNLFATNQKCKYDFKKHSKRRNGPRLLSLKLDLSLQLKLIQIIIYTRSLGGLSGAPNF